jgi:Ni2+-binding GTPase involved in maturation of urease and hydrogenase
LPGRGEIPVTVLTGFLGSGKTTVLNGLVKNQALRRTAVVINEFGEMGLDHELVQKSDENLMLVRNGCVCCTVRGDLISTLEDLSVRQQRGEIVTLSATDWLLRRASKLRATSFESGSRLVHFAHRQLATNPVRAVADPNHGLLRVER